MRLAEEQEARTVAFAENPSGQGTADTPPSAWDGIGSLDQAIGLVGGSALGVEDFDSRYRGATDAQILLAHVAAEIKLGRERTRIAEELLASGRYDETVSQVGGTPQPLVSANAGRRITSFGVRIEPGDGISIARTAVIDPQQFPEYHALELEYLWLAEKAHRLKKGL